MPNTTNEAFEKIERILSAVWSSNNNNNEAISNILYENDNKILCVVGQLSLNLFVGFCSSDNIYGHRGRNRTDRELLEYNVKAD